MTNAQSKLLPIINHTPGGKMLDRWIGMKRLPATAQKADIDAVNSFTALGTRSSM